VSAVPGAELELEDALAALRADGLVAYPTETVWGLGADARSPRAVARLRAWKGRGASRPIAVLVPDASVLDALGAPLPEPGRRLAGAFWPGPLTLVVRCSGRFAPEVGRAHAGLGLRCSPHPAARALARAAWERGIGPLTATSLNRSGDPPARTRQEAAALCGSAPGEPRLLAGPWPDAGGADPSSVVDLTGAAPVLRREGSLPAAALAAALGGPLAEAAAP
jgi:L-threonylcarbamoyladenylate synthase